jgi:AcrR family transcriptional regulator
MRIVVAVADVVAERGYAATSVGAIAERAGVSTRAFYELFDGKEDAFLAAYTAIDLVIARMTEAAAAAAEAGPRAMLHAGARAYLETLAAEPAFTRMLVIEAVGAGPRVLARRTRAFGDFVGVLAVPLRLGPGARPSDAILLAVLGGINELVLEHVVEHGAGTLVDLTPTVEQLLDRLL